MQITVSYIIFCNMMWRWRLWQNFVSFFVFSIIIILFSEHQNDFTNAVNSCVAIFFLILIFHHKVSVFFSFFHAHFSFLKVLFLINIPFNFWDFWIFVCLFSFRKNVVKSDGVIFVSSFFITFLFTFGRGVRFYTPALLRMAASGQGFLLLPASFEDKIRATFEFSFSQ